MKNTTHDHLVTIDQDARCTRIFRITPDGEKTLFTEYDLPGSDNKGWTDKVTEFAHLLGEDLIMDSPITRYLYAL